MTQNGQTDGAKTNGFPVRRPGGLQIKTLNHTGFICSLLNKTVTNHFIALTGFYCEIKILHAKCKLHTTLFL